MSDYTGVVRSQLIFAVFLFSTSFGITQVPPALAPVSPAPALSKISDLSLPDTLVNKLKAEIAASPNVNALQGSKNPNFNLNDLYNILVRFSAGRETYTEALSHYADVFRDHPGFTGIVYRDQAYSQLVQSADTLLGSLKDLKEYLRYSGVAVQADTAQMSATLEQFTDAKGIELHSVVDTLHLAGLTADQLQSLSAKAAQNGATLKNQILILQSMLIQKGASLRTAR